MEEAEKRPLKPQSLEEKRLFVINSMLKYWRKKEKIATLMIQRLVMLKKTLEGVGLIEKDYKLNQK